ncbi:MAG: hypothetical protein A2051_04530 [Desulfovibrionales bacterium GWA2_65_9]|nr:MAG: hypothetical protein A2051_04530 [Desulfovibrionales bacterium GWA2_65_9]
MPLALNVGTGIMKGVLQGAVGSSGGTEISEAAEVRAQTAEAQARRQAEAEELRAREQAEGLREDNQHRRARARVAAAGSGLTLSGTSLLNLQSLEHQQEDQLGQLLGDSARRAADILASGAEQAQSIRLSGRRSRVSDDGLGSLLRLGGQVFNGGFGGKAGVFTTVPAERSGSDGWGGGSVFDY